MNYDEYDRLACALGAMSHEFRLTIVSILAHEEVSSQDLSDRLRTSQSNLSAHLGVLWDAGVIRFRKDGRRVFYRISDPRILRVLFDLQQLSLR